MCTGEKWLDCHIIITLIENGRAEEEILSDPPNKSASKSKGPQEKGRSARTLIDP